MADEFGFVPEDEDELGFVSDEISPEPSPLEPTAPPVVPQESTPYIDPAQPAPVRPLESMMEGELDPQTVSKGQSFMGGGAKMSTFGFAPEIVGYLRSKKEKAPFGATTKDFIKREKERMNLLKKANPKMFTAGEVAGTIPSMLLIPTGASHAQQAKNLSTISKMIRASKGFITPTIESAITAAGYSDAEDFKGRVKDAGMGAAFGIATHGLAKTVGKVVPKKLKQGFLDLGKKLKKGAEMKTLDAMGLYGKKRAKHLFDTESLKTLVKDRKMARRILDDKNIKLNSKTRSIFERAIKESEKQGRKIGDFYAKLDSLGENNLDAQKLAVELYDSIQKEFKGKMDRTKLNAMTKALEDMYDLPVDANGKTTFKEVQKFKRKLDSKIKKWGVPDERYDGYKTAREKLRKALIKGTAEAGANPRELISLNMKFRDLAHVNELANMVGNKNLAKEIQDTLKLNPWSVNYVANNAALAAATKGISLLDKFRTGRYSSTSAVLKDFMSKRATELGKNKKLWAIVSKGTQLQGEGRIASLHALLYAKSKNYRDEFRQFVDDEEDTDIKAPYSKVGQ